MTHHVVAFSGGKDSTAMLLAMVDLGMRVDSVLITPTGDELPEMVDHWQKVSDLVGIELTVPKGPTLQDVIASENALPNFRMRFCTRMVKIVPAIAWVARQAEGVVMYVGLRADEQERKGIISNDVPTAFPLRDLGWGLAAVTAYLKLRGVKIPRRTDCARCYHQRLDEWWDLWDQHPEIFEDAVQQEERLGHTFRTPGRDSWGVALADLRAEFEAGKLPRAVDRRRQQLLPLFEDDEDDGRLCRVCSL